eukprot:PhM_4_TR16555/c1_g1_i1/m.101293
MSQQQQQQQQYISDEEIPYQARVIRIIRHYDAARLTEVGELVAANLGKLAALVDALEREYGPEPPNTYKDRIRRFYEKYNPNNLQHVDILLDDYAGNEEELIRALVGKYGPEPPVTADNSNEREADTEAASPHRTDRTATPASTSQTMLAIPDETVAAAPTVSTAQSKGSPRVKNRTRSANVQGQPSPAIAGAASPSTTTRINVMLWYYAPKKLSLLEEWQKSTTEETILSDLIATHGPEPTRTDLVRQLESIMQSDRAPGASEDVTTLLQRFPNRETDLFLRICERLGVEDVDAIRFEQVQQNKTPSQQNKNQSSDDITNGDKIDTDISSRGQNPKADAALARFKSCLHDGGVGLDAVQSMTPSEVRSLASELGFTTLEAVLISSTLLPSSGIPSLPAPLSPPLNRANNNRGGVAASCDSDAAAAADGTQYNLQEIAATSARYADVLAELESFTQLESDQIKVKSMHYVKNARLNDSYLQARSLLPADGRVFTVCYALNGLDVDNPDALAAAYRDIASRGLSPHSTAKQLRFPTTLRTQKNNDTSSTSVSGASLIAVCEVALGRTVYAPHVPSSVELETFFLEGYDSVCVTHRGEPTEYFVRHTRQVMPRYIAQVSLGGAPSTSSEALPQHDAHQHQYASLMPRCPQHNEYISLWCVRDKVGICPHCRVIGWHAGHECVDLRQANDLWNVSTATEALHRANACEEDWRDLFRRVTEESDRWVRAQSAEIEAVEAYVAELKAKLDERVKQLRTEAKASALEGTREFSLCGKSIQLALGEMTRQKQRLGAALETGGSVLEGLEAQSIIERLAANTTLTMPSPVMMRVNVPGISSDAVDTVLPVASQRASERSPHRPSELMSTPMFDNGLNVSTPNNNNNNDVSTTSLFDTVTTPLSPPRPRPSTIPGTTVIDLKYRNTDFDENGVVHYIGTEGLTLPFSNPHLSAKVHVSTLAGMHSKSVGNEATLVSRKHDVFTLTNDVPGGWVCVDLGARRRLQPTHYTLCHGFAKSNMALRNWVFEGSNDIAAPVSEWVELRRHVSDGALGGEYGTHTWSVLASVPPVPPLRYFRLRQTGATQSSTSFHICISGIELYGTLYTQHQQQQQ